MIYIGEAVGTLNKEGSFWVMNGDVNKLKEVLQNSEAKTDLEAGVIAVRKGQNSPDRVSPRSCTINPGDDYVDSETINNGTNNGSTELVAQFAFFSEILPFNSTIVEISTKAYMVGWSHRRKTCGCGWKTYTDDHMFYWNIEIGQGISGPITNYSGQDTHYNVQRAQKNIFIQSGLYLATTIYQNSYYLNKVDFDTRHTTDNLDLPGISYMCN